MSFHMNTPPSVPVPIRPIDLAVVSVRNLRLAVMNAGDAEGDSRQYDFEIAENPGMIPQVEQRQAVANPESSLASS